MLLGFLQKYVSVDVFGECGPWKCQSESVGNESPDNECYQLLNTTYKFYLAWENAICEDYVTEKFYNILQYNVIPVVLNGADMSKVAPPHSYINVEDFHSLEELSQYLDKVASDDELFASYFWWRDFYKVKLGMEAEVSFWCDLCQLLHEEQDQKTFDIKKFSNPFSSCRHSKFFKQSDKFKYHLPM